jgi:hypothetical protein
MIVNYKKQGNIMVYYVGKDVSDEDLTYLLDTQIKKKQIPFIIDHDADVYTTEGKLLLKFRKKVLDKKYVADFYNNVIHFANRITTTNRGTATGSTAKNIKDNPKVYSNIFGYFDKWSPSQKVLFREKGLLDISVRETRFTRDYPNEFLQMIPLIEQIDFYYKKLVPEKYKLQKAKANKTPFRIGNSVFTTITTNITAVHTDKGDDIEGFGNLVVIEYGKYTGGETCFIQYGIGVDVRTGDVLLMDVHQAHANLPIKLKTNDSKRLSIVCYLRTSIWEQTKNWTRNQMQKHIDYINSIGN